MRLSRFGLLATLFIIIDSFNNAGAATLTETPANIAQGGTVTANWNAIAAPTSRDWIGLYPSGATDTAFMDWIYINSCNKSGADAAAPASGSCPFPVLGSLANGIYELRLLANNGYTRLAQSNQFNVSLIPLRFVDNGDETITDLQTGLMWEKKTGTFSGGTVCSSPPTCPDPHDVNNVYMWSTTPSTLPNPDGPLFTNFLARINTEISFSADGSKVTDVCFAGHCDWRIPNIAELRTILLPTCQGGGSPCIDPIFGPVSVHYWSSTAGPGPGSFVAVWVVISVNGFVGTSSPQVTYAARAVRGAR